MVSPEREHWKTAMDAEVNKIKNAETFSLEHVPNDNRSNVIKCRWVFRKKLDLQGNVKEYKARLVTKRFTQRYGIDFYETFVPVVKLKSIRLLAQIAASSNLTLYQDDAPSAFLNGVLKERIIVEHIPGYDDNPGRLCVLKKTLYGLKQAPSEWNEVVDSFLRSQGIQPTKSDPCVYIKNTKLGLLICAVYVDDIITGGNDTNIELHSFREKLHKRFNMTKKGLLELYLGCHFERSSDGSYSINPTQYLERKMKEFDNYIPKGIRSSPLPSNYEELLEKAVKDDAISNDFFPYREMVGILMYAMVTTRAQSLSVVSRYLSCPKQVHCDLVMHIYMYVRGTVDFSLKYNADSSLKLTRYVDAAYGNNKNHTSTTGYCFKLEEGLISWYSKGQDTVAFSAAEAENIAPTEAAKEAIWFRVFLEELGFPQKCTVLHEDNQVCILLSKNPQLHARKKHIRIKYHFIREKVLLKELEWKYASTKHQLADMFKGVPGCQLCKSLSSLNCKVYFKSRGESNVMNHQSNILTYRKRTKKQCKQLNNDRESIKAQKE
jgi:hypothetical protein